MLLANYRLPYSDSYIEVRQSGEPILLYSIEELRGIEGFVIAPFDISPQTPLVVIPAKDAKITEKHCSQKPCSVDCSVKEILPISASYKKDFNNFHEAITSGHFAKLVLARISRQEHPQQNPESLFLYFCHKYPRAMVMLFDTPQTGTWIMATPEILLEQQKSLFRTMALAGTMPFCEGFPEWSEKNKHEQNIVELYIESIISPFCDQIIKDGPQTVRAGNLMHLRTDFRFHLKSEVSTADLLARLHPTPAVCGLPKDEAKKFIIKNESIDRKYYSGFAGPLNLNGETHLYVSLRCMNIVDNQYIVYAGGGIMSESVAEEEWKETELKIINRV